MLALPDGGAFGPVELADRACNDHIPAHSVGEEPRERREHRPHRPAAVAAIAELADQRQYVVDADLVQATVP